MADWPRQMVCTGGNSGETGFLINFSRESFARMWWGCFLDLNRIDTPYERRKNTVSSLHE